MANIMILGAGLMQVPIIKKAKELGHFVITIDRDKNAIGNKYAQCPLEIDTNNYVEILEAAKRYKINGILTTSDFPVRNVALVCDKLNLTGPKVKATEICTDKYLMRKHLFENNFNVPKFSLIEKTEDIDEVDFYPAVLKPLDSSGSRGVKLVKTKKDLISSFSQSLKFSRSGKLIVEEFIQGKEYSVETLSQNGKTHVIAITEKTIKGSEDIFFVEDRHVIPANLSPKDEKLINKSVTKLINSLNLGDSATHTELKINENGLYFIEVGARLGGDFITSDLVPLATGVDMLDNIIRISLGEKVQATKTKNMYAGVQFLNSVNYEKANNFINVNKNILSKFQVEPFKDLSLESSFSRLGYLIAVSETRENLNYILDFRYKEK